MEMYADSTARGGVLEPGGIVEVKYRKKDLLKTMHRVDPILRELDEQVKAFKATQPARERSSSITPVQPVPEREKPKELKELETKIQERENLLLPMFHQVSIHFADLHDTPERMLEKGAISVSGLILNRLVLYFPSGCSVPSLRLGTRFL